MGDGHGGIFCQQELGHRLADDIGAADHHRLEARQRRMHRLRQHDAAKRRAWRQRRQAGGKPAGIDRMKAIDVLPRIDGIQHLLGIDLLRQRQLHQDAMHRRVGVELLHQRHQFGLVDAVRQPMIERLHAGFLRRLGLAADIGLARRIVAGQHDRKPGRNAMLRGETFHLARDPDAKLRRDRLAVDDLCAHGGFSSSHRRSSPAQRRALGGGPQSSAA